LGGWAHPAKNSAARRNRTNKTCAVCIFPPHFRSIKSIIILPFLSPLMDVPPASAAKPEEKLEFATAFKGIQVALDYYQDIFSDFDTAPYSHRTISNDFLGEIERRYVESKPGEFEVRMTLPAKERDPKVEAVIKKRLKDYFILKLKEKDDEIAKKRRTAYVRIATGVLLMVVVFEIPFGQSLAVSNILSVPGWFLLWSGFENIFDIPGRLAEERQFVLRFSKAKYHFFSEEEISGVFEKQPEPLPVPISEQEHT